MTGAAGFIGSNLVDRLLHDGDVVVGYDNLSTGMSEFVEANRRHRNFTFVQGDLLDPRRLAAAMSGQIASFILLRMLMCVWARSPAQRPRTKHNRDIQRAEAMRANNVQRFFLLDWLDLR